MPGMKKRYQQRRRRDLCTASYLRKITGLREWVIRENCPCRGYNADLVELYSREEVEALKLRRRQERERRRLELVQLKRKGLQLCRSCGAVIKYPGAYYCANPGCWPPSWRQRLERQMARETD